MTDLHYGNLNKRVSERDKDSSLSSALEAVHTVVVGGGAADTGIFGGRGGEG